MAGIRHVIQATVAIAILCIADISTVQVKTTVMYREGCIANNSDLVTNVTDANMNASTQLPNNYPGTCLAYCDRQGIYATYIALKDTDCRCGVTSYTTVNSTKACPNTCPGHDAHFCGGPWDFSLYILANDTITIDKDTSDLIIFSCLAINCRSNGGIDPVVTGLNCMGQGHVPYCTHNSPYILHDAECPQPTDVWNQSLSLCSTIQKYKGIYEDRYYRLKTNTKSGCTYGIGCLPIRWIGAFAAWAPRKPPCSVPSAPPHGNVIVPYKDKGGDNETIIYSCTTPGYRLHGTATQFCMSDSNWSGKPPSCLPVPVTSPRPTAAPDTTTAPVTAPHLRRTVPYRCTAGPRHMQSSLSIATTCRLTEVVVNDRWSLNTGSNELTSDATGLSAGVIAAIVIGTCIAVALVSAAIGFLLKKYIFTGPKVGATDNWHDAVYDIRQNPSTNNLADDSCINGSDAFGSGYRTQVIQEVSTCCWSWSSCCWRKRK